MAKRLFPMTFVTPVRLIVGLLMGVIVIGLLVPAPSSGQDQPTSTPSGDRIQVTTDDLATPISPPPGSDEIVERPRPGTRQGRGDRSPANASSTDSPVLRGAAAYLAARFRCLRTFLETVWRIPGNWFR